MKCSQCGSEGARILYNECYICQTCAIDLSLYMLHELNKNIEQLNAEIVNLQNAIKILQRLLYD